ASTPPTASLLSSTTPPRPPALHLLSLHAALPISTRNSCSPGRTGPASRSTPGPAGRPACTAAGTGRPGPVGTGPAAVQAGLPARSEEHTSELQSPDQLV